MKTSAAAWWRRKCETRSQLQLQVRQSVSDRKMHSKGDNDRNKKETETDKNTALLDR
jgi:hypothetical protein